jgi:chromosome segregation ATPase
MAFINNLGKKLGSAAGATAAKAKDLAETTKLNSQISDQEKQIQKLYAEIGEKIFELEKENTESPVRDLCDKISAAQQNIEQLKQKIDAIKN